MKEKTLLFLLVGRRVAIDMGKVSGEQVYGVGGGFIMAQLKLRFIINNFWNKPHKLFNYCLEKPQSHRQLACKSIKQSPQREENPNAFCKRKRH